MNRAMTCRRCGDPSESPRCASCARLERFLRTVQVDVKEAEAYGKMAAHVIAEEAKAGGYR